MAYLSYGFSVSHDGLLDETPDLHVSIPARYNHPGPPETHRHFHNEPRPDAPTAPFIQQIKSS